MPQMPESHSVRDKVVHNTLSQIAGRAVGAFSTLAITVMVARTLGVQGYGDFVKITTYVSFFYLLADFGLNAIYLQQSVVLEKDKSDVSWSVLLGLRIALSIILVVAAAFVLFLLPRSDTGGYTALVRYAIIIFTPTIFFQSLITSCNALFQKHFRYDLSTIAILLGSAVSVALLYLASSGYIPFTLFSVIIILLTGSAATAMTGLFFSKSFIRGAKLQTELHKYISLFQASIPLGLTLIFNLIYFHIDSIILTLSRPTAEVGIYGLAFKVFELPLVLPTFFMNALYPVMLGVKGISFKKLILKSAGILLFVSSLLTVVVWFTAPLLVYIKSDFMLSIEALRILTLGLPLFFLSSLTMWTLITKKQQLKLVYIYGFSMIINIGLNAIFTPVYGYRAAAWITVFSEGLVLLLSVGTVAKTISRE